MSKRTADQSEEDEIRALKSGQRPQDGQPDDLEFEDEFEDEFESEDEILEAGVDGRPDEEREAEEREGVYLFPLLAESSNADERSGHGPRPRHFYPRTTQTRSWTNAGPGYFDVRDAAQPGSPMALSFV